MKRSRLGLPQSTELDSLAHPFNLDLNHLVSEVTENLIAVSDNQN